MCNSVYCSYSHILIDESSEHDTKRLSPLLKINKHVMKLSCAVKEYK